MNKEKIIVCTTQQNTNEQSTMILVDLEKYENLIATKHYVTGKLSEIEKQLLLQEQIGFLKAENRILKERVMDEK